MKNRANSGSPEKSATITIRVGHNTRKRLEASAKRQDRKAAGIARQAIEDYLSVQDWQERRIREALTSAESGEGIEHEKVMFWLNSWDSDSEVVSPHV